MITIHKFPFPTTDKFSIEMPKGAEILTAQVQHMQPCMWAIVDTASEKESRNFSVVGTGHALDTSIERKYIGTFQLLGGNFVGHLFEI